MRSLWPSPLEGARGDGQSGTSLTVWADEENIYDAREQLRHKNVETTIGYAHSGAENRHNSVNSKW